MTINLGATEISGIKLGNTQIDSAYLGDTQVWGGSEPGELRALKFECAGNQTLGINQSSLGTITPNFEYSNDGQTWANWDITTTLAFGNGVDLYVRGMNNILANSSKYTTFVFSTSEPVNCSGNIMHLFDYTQDLTAFPTAEGSAGTKAMFYNCTQLVSAPKLPATTLLARCYNLMFWNCTSLVHPPELPATSLTEGCYHSMFMRCRVLNNPPALPATTLANNCYFNMFYGCWGLTNAPSLPALNIPSSAYGYMFSGCTSLASIPALPATFLGANCYAQMFDGCSLIKMSVTEVDEYTNEYSFGTNPSAYAYNIFRNTGGTFTGTANQTTYYTANTIIY